MVSVNILAKGCSNLAFWTEITGPAQVLDLLYCCSAVRAGFSGGGAVHQADVASRLAEQVGFVIAPALRDDFLHGIDNSYIQIPALTITQFG